MPTLTLVTTRLLGWSSVLVFVTLVLDVLWGVLTRYALGGQAGWSEELARLLLIWLSMFGTALAYASRSHLGVDVLPQLMTPGPRRLALIAIHTLVLVFAASVMVYGGTTLFLERLDAGQVMSTLPMRKAWMYLSIPVSGLLIVIFAIDEIGDAWRGGPPLSPTPEPR